MVHIRERRLTWTGEKRLKPRRRENRLTPTGGQKHLMRARSVPAATARLYSTTPLHGNTHSTLTHLTPSGHAQMVSIGSKETTRRQAVAQCRVNFSQQATLALVRADQMKKGDVLQIARIAGIMAAKRTSDLIPLCHPLALDHIHVEAEACDSPHAGIRITATVTCHGKTGVEMEALTAASVAAMTVYDMCKAVDRAMVIDGLCIVRKEGGKSGTWPQ